jgi:protein-L-isoaspartate(D-aspartate) O-methyltransferase
VTACAPGLPPALLSQVRDGGYILLPVVDGDRQRLFRFERRGEKLAVEESLPCGFVPLRPGIEQGSGHA